MSDEGYDPSVHLNNDLAIDDPRRQSFLQVTIKQSKTDPFRKGVEPLPSGCHPPLYAILRYSPRGLVYLWGWPAATAESFRRVGLG